MLLFISEPHLCGKSFLTTGADNGVLSLSFGKTKDCLAVSAFYVSVALKIADAVFLQNKKVLDCAKNLHKGFVFFSACPYVFGKNSEDHPSKRRGLKSV